ncbi:RraA family protein [Lignipirellula cremea]|nr:RraA family protein [Lignipirellula cremea]
MSEITIEMMRASLYSAVVADALDAAGRTLQSPRMPWLQVAGAGVLVGRCRTTLWVDMAHEDPTPYDLELKAVDACQPDDVFIVAAAGSLRSAAWGELLSTAARAQGCVGAIVDGGARDSAKLGAMNFPVFARGMSVYDSKNRQRVVDIDIPVEIEGVLFSPGDLVFADTDGVVVVPQAVEEEVIQSAWKKAHDENKVRDALAGGMSATEAFRVYGVL